MFPIVSRSSMMKACKDFVKYASKNESEDVQDSNTARGNFDNFLEEKAIQQEKLENGFYDYMFESSLSPLEYVAEIGRIDSELPGKNKEQFENMLEFFWNGVYSKLYELTNVVDVLCSAFPNYERIILKSAFFAYLYEEIECDYEFALLLDRIADYDEIDDFSPFSSDENSQFELEDNEMHLNLRDTNIIRAMFDTFIPSSPIADVIWILEERFQVDEDFLNDIAYQVICGFYAEYSADELECDNAFNEIFKLPYGYSLFNGYLPNIIINGCSWRTVDKLGDKYGINVLHMDCVYGEHKDNENN